MLLAPNLKKMPGKLFISLYSGDCHLLSAFKDMVNDASVGSIEFLHSEQIEGGELWYQKIIKLIKTSDELVVLLTKEGMGRHWIPFEVGMAKALGKRATIVAFGLSLEEVRKGPFQQFENFADNEQQLTKLVNELLKRYVPGANPREQEIRRRVRAFAKFLPPAKATGGIVNDTELEFLIKGCLETACRAMAVPWDLEVAAIRAFVFKLDPQAQQLICTHHWSKEPPDELESVADFPKREPFTSYAIWRAVQTKRPCLQAVNPQLQAKTAEEKNVDIKISDVLAAPIRVEGCIWGVVDFDTKTESGRNILRSESAMSALVSLSEHLGTILSLRTIHNP
jgi:hypothetical protein